MGKSKNGSFRNVRAEALSAAMMTALLERNDALNPADIEDVMWGCVNQTKEQGFNIARNAAVLAGIPHCCRPNDQPSVWFIYGCTACGRPEYYDG
jgi:acetyl-CoA acyltransferase